MKAIILAAGVGSRLKAITKIKPKCMINVSGIPIIAHQINAYIDAGVNDIIVATGYKNEIVTGYLASKYSSKVKIVENPDYSKTNNMYSLYLAKDELNGTDFILSNGDVIFEPSIIDDLVNKAGSDVIACDQGSYDEEAMKISIDNDGNIKNISKNTLSDSAYGNSIDLYRFSVLSSRIFFRELIQIIEVENDINSWVEVAIDRLLRNEQLKMKPFDIAHRRWVEVDNMGDLLIADKVFSQITSLRGKKLFLIDLDGTIYLGDNVISGAVSFIQMLQRENKHFYFMSNNSSKSKADYVNKLKTMGIIISEREIILSTDGVIEFLSNNGYYNVYLIGTDSMKQTFKEAGFNMASNKPQCLVLGYDTELTYAKLREASLLLQKGIDYYATHCDVVCPTPQGPIPDIGSFLILLKSVTGRSPDKIFGKPNIEMVSKIIKSHDMLPTDIVIIADRLYTDMELAKRIGCNFICVLSGETKREDIEMIANHPDLIVNNVGELLSLVNN